MDMEDQNQSTTPSNPETSSGSASQPGQSSPPPSPPPPSPVAPELPPATASSSTAYAYPPPYTPTYTPVPQTNVWAIVSLVVGILSWFVLPVIGGIAAVIAGIVARDQIASSNGTQTGDGLALTGIILGGINVLGLCLIACCIAALFGWFLPFMVGFGR